jgi:elongation factor G
MPATRARPGSERTAIRELWHVHADRHEPAPAAGPGEIVVVPGEFDLHTGDTLCDPNAVVTLAAPRFPAPVLAVAFEPAQAGDMTPLANALRELAVDDPTLRVDRDDDRLFVRGMGELHLDIVADVVRGKTGIAFTCSKPQVDRRETFAASGIGTAEVRAFVGGEERAARCVVAVEPSPDRGPARVVDLARSPGAAAAIEELGHRAASGLRVGPLYGAVIALRAASGDRAEPCEPLFQQAAAKALANAVEQAGLVELEPWVRLEVLCPESAKTAVLADLGARGGEVTSIAAGRLGARIEAKAPLARMLGYVTKLRSMTKGLGQVFLRPIGYAANGRTED